MNKIRFSRTLMIAAILLIVAFQAYWLNRLYREEKDGMSKETKSLFRDLVYNLQLERFKADTFFVNYKEPGNNLFIYDAVNAIRRKMAAIKKDSTGSAKPDSLSAPKARFFFVGPGRGRIDTIISKGKSDSTKRFSITVTTNPGADVKLQHELPAMPDTTLLKQMAKERLNEMMQSLPATAKVLNKKMIHDLPRPEDLKRVDVVKSHRGGMSAEKSFVRLIANGKTLEDTISVRKLDSAYKKELTKAGIGVAFHIKMGKYDTLHAMDTAAQGILATAIAKVGILHPYWYQASFDNATGYLLRKILPQIFFSLFLVAFTSIAFVFLYRSLAAQRRLTEIKNDFISNITHELKTPIATVNVAIEALRDFGGLKDPQRTKEYLDISVVELQRLSLLVDKVLKFSLFENREIELHKEPFDLKQLVADVVDSMKLQFEKRNAQVTIENTGDNFMFDADKLHITSVIYNLVDNALKYTKEEPRIGIQLTRHPDYFELRVADNGVGISEEYKRKIFEQFFRVPNGDRHNIKGYGLGLSYVNHIVQQHHGFIEVDSTVGKGSTFIVKFAFTDRRVVQFDKDRKMRRLFFSNRRP